MFYFGQSQIENCRLDEVVKICINRNQMTEIPIMNKASNIKKSKNLMWFQTSLNMTQFVLLNTKDSILILLNIYFLSFFGLPVAIIGHIFLRTQILESQIYWPFFQHSFITNISLNQVSIVDPQVNYHFLSKMSTCPQLLVSCLFQIG